MWLLRGVQRQGDVVQCLGRGERENRGIQLLACLMTAKRPTSVSDQRVHAQPVKNTHTFRGMSEIAVLFKTSSF